VRRAAGRADIPQPIAANVDAIVVVTAVGPELNPARLARYLAAAGGSGAEVGVLVNKIDRCEGPSDRAELAARLEGIAQAAPVSWISATTGEGWEGFARRCAERTTVLVGSSGVGKSTIINRLLGGDRFATAATRARDDEGRHTTRRRELVALPGGGAIVDTPGMREIAVFGGEGDTGPRRPR
jgi:ribosome biogenesis GTPase